MCRSILPVLYIISHVCLMLRSEKDVEFLGTGVADSSELCDMGDGN